MRRPAALSDRIGMLTSRALSFDQTQPRAAACLFGSLRPLARVIVLKDHLLDFFKRQRFQTKDGVSEQ